MSASEEYINRPPLALTQHEREMIVAMFLIDEYGEDDYPEDRIDYATEWFKRVEHTMQESHNGDCVKVPMTCTRCVLERYADIATKISAALARGSKEPSR